MEQINVLKKVNKESEKNKKNARDGLLQKILANLTIDITDIAFRLDDDISNSAIPYSLRIILGKVLIRSTSANYVFPKNQDTTIFCDRFNHIVCLIDNFSIFLDIYTFVRIKLMKFHISISSRKKS